MNRNNRRINRNQVKTEKKDDDVCKLVRFAEGSKGASNPEEMREMRGRIQREKIELKRLKHNHKIQLNEKPKPTPKRKNNRLPPVSPSQPTMSQCLARMGEDLPFDSNDICVQDIPPFSQRMEYAQQDYTTEYDSDSYKSPSARKTASNASTPDSKIEASYPVPVTNEKERKKTPAPESPQAMVNHQEGLQASEQELIEFHESSINRDGQYDVLCPQCDTHFTYCHGKIYSAYCWAYAYQQFHLAPLNWSRKTCTMSYTRAYNRALDYIVFKEKNKLVIKAKFFPPACLKTNLDECCEEIEADLLQMRTEALTVDTSKLFDNEKSLKNKEEVVGEINPHMHSEEELEIMARDPKRCPGCLLMKHDCHNVLFGAYCKAKVHRYSDLYPSAMTGQAAEDVFLQKYQIALHIHIFWKYNILLTESKYTFPKRCLLDNMEETCDHMNQKHTVFLKSKNSKLVNVTEFKNAGMDFNGYDPDKV